jgi:biopolymer transport protein ExbD
MNHSQCPAAEVSTSSMADIAFLLLTFFLITTTIQNDKGLTIILPPHLIEVTSIPIHERNLFKIQVNSQNQFLVEGDLRKDLKGLREELKKFILNPERDPNLSENPVKAVVSLKTDRGTTHQAFISALDEIQAAYYEIYGQRTGLSAATFRDLNLTIPENKKLYDKGRKDLPMNISIAEPTSINR